MKIYAAIIGKNEQKALPKCLKSLGEFDGIYFTDTGSNDDTRTIAHSFGCKVSRTKWVGDFSKARNFNLDRIPKNEWVFIIDCDEWLKKGDYQKIVEAAKKSKSGHCLAHVKNVVTGGEHQHLRFFKNNIRYKDAAHTHIPVADFEPTDVVIYHEPSENHIKDPKRTLRILESVKRYTPRLRYELGREQFGHGQIRKAIKTLELYMKTARPDAQTCDALLYLALSYFKNNQLQKAKLAALNAIGINPEFKEGLIAMATFSEPWAMRAWARYAKAAENFGLSNINGQQAERIAELEKISRDAMAGVPLETIFKDEAK